MGRIATGLLLLTLIDASTSGEPPKTPSSPQQLARRRQPVALTITDGGHRLWVANLRSGSISVLDTDRRRVEDEWDVGEAVSDLISMPDGRSLLAVDSASHRLLWLEREGTTLTRRASRDIAAFPVTVRANNLGTRVVVASLWSRRLSAFDLDRDPAADAALRPAWSVDLPFCPRHLLILEPPGKVLVADAFGGGLAVVDLEHGRIEARHEWPIHNIGGLALSRDHRVVWLTHQTINPKARTTTDDIHWGFLFTNNVRSADVDAIVHAERSDSGASRTLGGFGNGAGDPSGLCELADGNLMVALAGLGQITAGPSARPDTWGLEVGGRPTVIALAPDGRRAFVACSFDDSIAILDHREGRLVARVPLGPPRRIDDIERGERLFHDARLSHEGWMSCHGCHSEGHTSGRLADTFGDRSYGTPKRTPSLLGIAGTAPFGWDGGVSSLEEQIVRSIRTTMRGPEPSTDQVRDLAAYLRSLPPPPSAASLTSRHTAEAIERGRSVFLRERCDRCHEPPGFTSTRVFHVGLTDELGMSRFNPPSLRGLSQRGALLHDGRARDATDVLTRQGHPSRIELSGPELADLLSFLDSL